MSHSNASSVLCRRLSSGFTRFVLPVLAVVAPVRAQTTTCEPLFTGRHVITYDVLNPLSVFAADLNGDGIKDVLSASSEDGKIAWYEAIDGFGAFGPQQVITTQALGAIPVIAADLDSDGDIDVLTASTVDHTIAWYENANGLGGFGPRRVIMTAVASDGSVNGGLTVFAGDLDGDGDNDVLFASKVDSIIGWYENMDGTGTFGPRRTLSTDNTNGVVDVTDLDNDGDLDVISSFSGFNAAPGFVVWYENTNGRGSFSAARTIQSSGSTRIAISGGDLDGDGDNDVLVVLNEPVGGGGSDENFRTVLRWKENLGNEAFGTSRFIGTTSLGFAIDVDGDGDTDVVSGSQWFENTDGLGTFVGPRSMGGSLVRAPAGDLDGDGDNDFLATWQNSIRWVENNADCNANGIGDGCDTTDMTSPDCDGNGAPDACDVLEADCNANGQPDECDIANGISADRNRNSKPDECEPIINTPIFSTIINETGDGQGHPLTSVSAMIRDDATGTIYVAGSASDNVFRVDTDGTITEVINANGDGNGNTLDSPDLLALDGADNLYVSSFNSDSVFKVTPTGTITQIIDLTGDGVRNGLRGVRVLAVDKSNNAYVGGDASKNVFKITPDGVITEILDEFGDGNGHMLISPKNIAFDAAGNAYLADAGSTVFKITPSGAITAIIDFDGDSSGEVLVNPGALSLDNAGNLYVAGRSSDNVFKITPSGTIAAIINASGDGQGNGLEFPRALAIDDSGNVYVTSGVFQAGPHNTFKITPDGVATKIMDTNGDGRGHTFEVGTSIAVDSVGNVYVSAGGRGNVFANVGGTGNAFRITPSGEIVQVIGRFKGDDEGHHYDGAPIIVGDEGNLLTAALNNSFGRFGVLRVSFDCNTNGIPDATDIANGTSTDCNGNSIPDECDGGGAGPIDCNSNGVLDECDIAGGTSTDCNNDARPDECNILSGASQDCNFDGIPDECQPDKDCNANGTRDICDIGIGTSTDCNSDFVPDDCQPNEDCNANGIRDICDIGTGTSLDCNRNFAPDDCDIASGTSVDANGDAIPDECCTLSSAVFITAKKSRYLSLTSIGQAGVLSAIRVTPGPNPFFPTAENRSFWVAMPQAYADPTPTDVSATFIAAGLSCEPHYHDWSTIDTLNIFGAEITPQSSYTIELINEGCPTSLASNFSQPIQTSTAAFADLVEPFQSPADPVQPDFQDINELIQKFLLAPSAVAKPFAQLQPNVVVPAQSISFQDINVAIGAFLQRPYLDLPFSPQPCDCPSLVTCGVCFDSTQCASGVCNAGLCTDACGRCSP